ncbi:DUF4142 domain-containing protein [Sphingosinicella sp.]|uniref:DUF4142 domain-containing protein n=1 Tax=Sphingosinicella sp. TaxID=1917971 RepID=UPI002624D7F2|nr:DUF4142 domain-containing protein [Sphingosinicella sp.]
MRIHMLLILTAALAGCGQSGSDSGTAAQTADEGDRGGPGAVPARTPEGAEAALNATRDRIAETGVSEPLSSARDYVLRVAQASLYQVEAARIVAKGDLPPAMKAFAQELQAAHTAALEDLRTAAKASGHASLVPETVNQEQAEQLDELRGATGTRLQQLYRRQQEAAFEDMVQLHEQYEKYGNVPPLMRYAGRYRPVETEHLLRIRDDAMRVAQTLAPQ